MNEARTTGGPSPDLSTTTPDARSAHARGLWEVLVLGALGGVRRDERESFREALRRALHRPLLRRQALRLVVSAALISLLVVVVLTGCILSVEYVPTSGGAFESVRGVDQVGFGSWFARQMHLWCGRLAVVFSGLAILRMLFSADYKDRGPSKWVAAHLLFFTLLVFFASGVRLPSGALALGATAHLAALMGDVPLVGGLLRAVLVEPEADPQAVLTRLFVLHVVLLPWVLLFLVTIVHSTRTRPQGEYAPSAEQLRSAAPFWPDRVVEAGIAVVVVLGCAALASLVWPVPLGGPAVPGNPPTEVDPVFRPLSGIAGFFSAAPGSLGSVLGVSLMCAGASFLLLLAFLDRSPDRSPGRRKWIVAYGTAWFVLCLLFILASRARS